MGLRRDLLSKLPSPEVGQPVIERVRKHLKLSLEAKIEADRAEAEAVRIIEDEVLRAWLN
jgi:hypothetical protein